MQSFQNLHLHYSCIRKDIGTPFWWKKVDMNNIIMTPVVWHDVDCSLPLVTLFSQELYNERNLHIHNKIQNKYWAIKINEFLYDDICLHSTDHINVESQSPTMWNTSFIYVQILLLCNLIFCFCLYLIIVFINFHNFVLSLSINKGCQSKFVDRTLSHNIF